MSQKNKEKGADDARIASDIKKDEGNTPESTNKELPTFDVVFYIPTIYHKEISFLRDFEAKEKRSYTEDISDGQGPHRIYLEVEIEGSRQSKINKVVLKTFYELIMKKTQIVSAILLQPPFSTSHPPLSTPHSIPLPARSIFPIQHQQMG